MKDVLILIQNAKKCVIFNQYFGSIAEKELRSNTILVSKNFCSKKYMGQKKFGPNTMWSTKTKASKI